VFVIVEINNPIPKVVIKYTEAERKSSPKLPIIGNLKRIRAIVSPNANSNKAMSKKGINFPIKN